MAGEKAEQPSTKGKKSTEFTLQDVLTENQVRETETGERALLTLGAVSRQRSLGCRNNNYMERIFPLLFFFNMYIIYA